jgi:HEAT repeat protein
MKDGSAVEPLLKMLSDEDAEVRLAALDALAIRVWQQPLHISGIHLTDNAIHRALSRARSKINPRLATVYALAEKKDASAVEPLLKMLSDEDVEVRRAAYDALCNRADGRQALAQYLAKYHNDIKQNLRSSFPDQRGTSDKAMLASRDRRF